MLFNNSLIKKFVSENQKFTFNLSQTDQFHKQISQNPLIGLKNHSKTSQKAYRYDFHMKTLFFFKPNFWLSVFFMFHIGCTKMSSWIRVDLGAERFSANTVTKNVSLNLDFWRMSSRWGLRKKLFIFCVERLDRF